jgi:hypothetical protein
MNMVLAFMLLTQLNVRLLAVNQCVLADAVVSELKKVRSLRRRG